MFPTLITISPTFSVNAGPIRYPNTGHMTYELKSRKANSHHWVPFIPFPHPNSLLFASISMKTFKLVRSDLRMRLVELPFFL